MSFYSDLSDDVIGDRIRLCERACAELIRVSLQCADECLALQGDGEITACFVANLNCVELAESVIRVLSWTTPGNHPVAISILEACIEACAESVIACERMATLHANWVTCSATCHGLSNACTDLEVALSDW
jgi:hypothetical protein